VSKNKIKSLLTSESFYNYLSNMDYSDISFRPGMGIDRLCKKLNHIVDASIQYKVRLIFFSRD